MLCLPRKNLSVHGFSGLQDYKQFYIHVALTWLGCSQWNNYSTIKKLTELEN